MVEGRAGASPPRSQPGLTEELHELRRRAGNPSYREMSRETGIAASTLHEIFSGTNVPRSRTLESIVESLGGDVAYFRELWSEASSLRENIRLGQQWRDLPRSLLRANSSLTDEAQPLLTSGLSIYASYAREDDEATSGRIAKLVDGIANFCRNDTGRNVRVLHDISSISPGENWKDHIRLGFSSSTIFLVFISPAYFRNITCRQEFGEFMSFLEIRSQNSLVVPLLYARLDRVARYFSNDDLWKRASDLQWIDISRLRTLEPDSSSWLEIVDHVANRIDEILAAFSSPVPEEAGKSRDNSSPIAEFFNPLDMHALGHALDKLPTDLSHLKSLLGQVILKLQDAVPELQVTRPFTEKLTTSQRIEAATRPLSSELSSVSEIVIERFAVINMFLQVLFKSRDMQILQAGDRTISDLLGILKGLLLKSYDTLRNSDKIYDAAYEGMGYSGSLDQVLGKIQDACLHLADLCATATIWLDEIRIAESVGLHP